MPLRDLSPPRLDGELRLDDAARRAAADDFGHLIHRVPDAVLVPGSAEDVATVVEWAKAHRRQVAAQGRRHSVFARGQVEDGIAIDMTALRSVGEVQDDRIVVDAGATWNDVLAATIPAGRTPPVLTEYLDLSVGGTVVVGGVGAAAARHGVQSDNVLELEVVTGEGRLLRCSPEANPDLFDAVRAGLGQVAVITRATLGLVPAPTHVRRFLLFYRDLASMVADARVLDGDGRFTTVQGGVLPSPGGWRYRLDAVAWLGGDRTPGDGARDVEVPDRAGPDDAALLAGLSDMRTQAEVATVPYVEYVQRFAVLEQVTRDNGHWFHRHPWLTSFVGDDAVEAVVGDVLAGLDPDDLGPFGQVVLSAFPRRAVRSPLLRLPEDERCYAFNLVRMPERDDPAGADRLVRANRAVYERLLAAGGTLYPVSAFRMSQAEWRRHFGPEWARLEAAKRRYDPDHVLTPGYELFLTE